MLKSFKKNNTSYIFWTLLLVFIVTAILVSRALYADGGYFLLGSLVNSDDKFWPFYNDSKHIRLFIDFLNQLLPAAAIKLGYSIAVVELLFNINLFIAPVILYYLIYSIAKSLKKVELTVFVLMSTVLIVLGSSIFIINQAISFSFILWTLIFYSMMDRKAKIIDWIITSIALLITFRGHEMILVVAPIIIFSVLFKAYRKQALILHYFIGIVLILSFTHAVVWQITHDVSSQTTNFINILREFLSIDTLFNSSIAFPFLGFISIILIIILYHFKLKSILLSTYVSLLFQILIFCKLLYYKKFDPFLEYNYRVFISFGIPCFMLIALIFNSKVTRVSKTLITHIKRVLYLTGSVMLLWQIINNLNWDRYLQSLNNQLITSENKIINTKELPENAIRNIEYSWSWLWPTYSILLQNGIIDKIVMPIEFNEYYDIESPGHVDIPFLRIEQGNKYFDIHSLSDNSKENENTSIWNSSSLLKWYEGFSHLEQNDFRWTNSNNSILVLKNPNNLNKHSLLVLDGWAYVNEVQPEIELNISINGTSIKSFTFSYISLDHKDFSIQIDLPETSLDNDNILVGLHFKDLLSPKDLNLSIDNRKLGIAIEQLYFK